MRRLLGMFSVAAMAVPSGRMYCTMFDQFTEMAISVSFTCSMSLAVSPSRSPGFCCRNQWLVSTPWSSSESDALFMPHRPSQSISRRSALAVGLLSVGVSSAGSNEQAASSHTHSTAQAPSQKRCNALSEMCFGRRNISMRLRYFT